MPALNDYLYWIKDLDPDIARLDFGDQIANLAELHQARFPTLISFTLTPKTYQDFFEHNHLTSKIDHSLRSLNLLKPDTISTASHHLARLFSQTSFPDSLSLPILKAYHQLPSTNFFSISLNLPHRHHLGHFVTEHSPFIARGDANLFSSIKQAWSLLFSPEAIFSRTRHRLSHHSLQPFLIIQSLPSPEISGSLFTHHPQKDHPHSLLIEAIWGAPRNLLESTISPDVYIINRRTHKIHHIQVETQESKLSFVEHQPKITPVPLRFSTKQKLSLSQITQLVNLSHRLHQQFFYPQRALWIMHQDHFFLLSTATYHPSNSANISEPLLHQLDHLSLITSGIPASPGIVSAKARLITSHKHILQIKPGEIIISDHFFPDLVPFLKKISGIVTTQGGQISHAAILSRELKIPAIVAASAALKLIHTGDLITLNATSGDIYQGTISPPFPPPTIPSISISHTATKIFLIPRSSDNIDLLGQTSADGLGPLTLAEILTHHRLHPQELIHQNKSQYFHQHALQTFQQASFSFGTRPIIFQLSHQPSHQLLQLTGGSNHEPQEPHPHLGIRGVYKHLLSPHLLDLELNAFKSARSTLSLTNLHLMVPWCHFPPDFLQLKKHLASQGIIRSSSLKFWLSLDFPANITDLPQFFSSGVDHVLINFPQLAILSQGFDPINEAKPDRLNFDHPFLFSLLRQAIPLCHQHQVPVSLLYTHTPQPEFIHLLVSLGISSLFIPSPALSTTRQLLYQSETKLIS